MLNPSTGSSTLQDLVPFLGHLSDGCFSAFLFFKTVHIYNEKRI